MNEAEIIHLTEKALLLVLVLSLPPIIAASAVGTLVSLIQALTQIQEQTLSFAIKLIAVTITIFLTARWLGVELYNYSEIIFDQISKISGG
ncbi:type III secretion system export apparatus subunit SctS [Algicola sagamiensis]|uniref:type III secretion system export apparatus subunit SctS n=1 Tax=Algicola sagamiensis TaxID=163869 RepID=UPI00036ABB4C|nr:type III secretion system export apparatus subunit SctS [Algicola sagamiensis]